MGHSARSKPKRETRVRRLSIVARTKKTELQEGSIQRALERVVSSRKITESTGCSTARHGDTVSEPVALENSLAKICSGTNNHLQTTESGARG